jgi:DnaJ-domain-containing protein 1
MISSPASADCFEGLTDCDLSDYYAILGLSPGASPQSIKIAYRNLAREKHPDHQVNSSEAEKTSFSVEMARLNEAYDVLSDAAKRREYDEKLRVHELLATTATHASATTRSRVVGKTASGVRHTRPNGEITKTVIHQVSNHLLSSLTDKKTGFSWKQSKLDGFDWAILSDGWLSCYCVALRGFDLLDLAAIKRLINYAEIAVAQNKSRIRTSHFLFLVPFQQPSDWEAVSNECRRVFGDKERANLLGANVVLVLLELQHGNTLRFGLNVREKRVEQLLHLVGAPL